MHAFVTGGSGALGGAACRALAEAGFAVTVGYHTNRAAGDETASALRARGGKALSLGFDVTRPEAVVSAVANAAGEFGGIDTLVCAAAQDAAGLLFDVEPSDIARVLSVNVAGAIYSVRAALPWLMRSERGRVILLSSVLGTRACPGAAAYSASKGAIDSMTRALAVELGPKGITVNAVAPGYVNAGLGRGPVATAGEGISATVPARRAGTPEEIAAVVSFLATERASYVNGVVIPVDGGLLAGSRMSFKPGSALGARS